MFVGETCDETTDAETERARAKNFWWRVTALQRLQHVRTSEQLTLESSTVCCF